MPGATSRECIKKTRLAGRASKKCYQFGATNMSLLHDQSMREGAEAAKCEMTGKQPRRLVDYLLINKVALTHEIARDCSIGNVSDAACRARPYLEKRGITIACKLPSPRMRNKFGEESHSHEWRLQRLR